jgi:adenine-specific DNA-methyltransferase
MIAFDKAFQDVKKLAEQFQDNLAYYTKAEYQEAEARMHFINPFFEALGWDVTSKHHPNPYEQEVKVEKTQKQQQSKAQKRADYAFFMAPNFKDVKFFVEAKKPAVELKHPDNYFQTIRYGWNANTPIAVLTDFEQFHIIDCRYKLGNRSALEWILDQYKEKKPKDPTIAEKFNTYKFADYKEQVIDLLKRVCTVSVETMNIVNSMPGQKKC